MSHGRPLATRQLNIDVPMKTYEAIERFAKAKGISTRAYSKALFDAAFAARCGVTGDRDLDAVVAGTLLLHGKLDSSEIAATLGTTEATVEKIRRAWEQANG